MSENYYEPLTPQENEDSKGAQNIYNTNQSNIPQNEITFEHKDKDNVMCQRIIPYGIFLIFLLIISSVLVWIKKHIFTNYFCNACFIWYYFLFFIFTSKT